MSDKQIAPQDVPFRGIVEQALAGVYVSWDATFQYVNETFAAMFGYRPDEFVGTHFRDVVTPDRIDDVMEKFRQRITGEVPTIRYTTKCFHRDGHVIHLEVHGSLVEYRGRPAVAGVVIDITERVQREEELRRSREQLRELAVYVNTSREEQRAAFAREVHDVLGGMLTSVKMDVTRILRRAEAPELAEIRSIAADLVSLVQETIDTARQISDEARPRILDSQGLVPAIRDALGRFGKRHALQTSLTMEGREPSLSGARAIQSYRIFQEALTNIARHANAHGVAVRLRCEDGVFEMRVTDDGRGIERGSMRRGGIGLVSMAERAREIGATLQVEGDVAAAGTTVLLVVPITDQERTDGD